MFPESSLTSTCFAGTTVVCVTTGASVSVASTLRLLAGVERLLVSPRSDKLAAAYGNSSSEQALPSNISYERFLFRQFPEIMFCPRIILQLWNLNILYPAMCFFQLLRVILF